jgi:hypothetical protein
MGNKAKKINEKLARRQRAYDIAIKNGNRGFKKPGSMNYKKQA